MGSKTIHCCCTTPQMMFILLLVILGASFYFFPYGYNMQWIVAPGESAIVRNSEGNLIAPVWHKFIKVHSENATKNSLYGYFYSDCPQYAMESRLRQVESSFNRLNYATNAFFLNPGSTVNLTWQTQQEVYFYIYEGEQDYLAGKHPLYSSHGQTATSGELNNYGEFLTSNVYYFVYQAKSALGSVTGNANYQLKLAVFSNYTAEYTCDVGAGECDFELTRGTKNCVAIDIPNVDGTYETFYYFDLRVSARYGFYFPVFVVPALLLWLLISGSLYMSQKRTELSQYLEDRETSPLSAPTPAAPTPFAPSSIQESPEKGFAPGEPYPQPSQPAFGACPPSQPGYPPQQGGYPPQQGGYPAQGYSTYQ